ncbi:GGDEF domain-containing protein [Achromobacter insuavis]
MAETDFLTGLLNAAPSRAAWIRPCRNGAAPAALAFILFDIDDFKGINDTYGHASGDEALKTVAELCRQTLRQADVVARVGGEEFAVLCHVGAADQALEMAERMRQRIAQARVTAENGTVFGLTASFGVALARGTAARPTPCSAAPTNCFIAPRWKARTGWCPEIPADGGQPPSRRPKKTRRIRRGVCFEAGQSGTRVAFLSWVASVVSGRRRFRGPGASPSSSAAELQSAVSWRSVGTCAYSCVRRRPALRRERLGYPARPGCSGGNAGRHQERAPGHGPGVVNG